MTPTLWEQIKEIRFLDCASSRDHQVTVDDLQHRARLLRVVLAVLGMRWREPMPAVVHTLHTWLDSWSGIGQVVVGMARQGYDVQLTRYGTAGWRDVLPGGPN